MKATRLIALAFAVAVPLIGAAAHADADIVQIPVATAAPAAGVTRAEVQADTALWLAAGMNKYSTEEGAEDVNSAEYRKDLAVYTALRASPQYAVLVKDYQQGTPVSINVTREPLSVTIAQR